ncbi:hypothetical protein [Salinilacihabitans rarus]|uniref:hypothetical protein n=1 Tax=Salinilacihabitans rarus TaxID=2961596 RepID=UPI0020C90EB6|nr:hypothetical protein [Salinilacihabitans rarus]
MPSHLLETYPAHILRSVTSSGLWNRLILSAAPLDDFKDARREIVSLYGEVYSEVDEVRESFAEKSNPQLREWAVKPHARIPEYDPHETVTRLLSFPAKLMGWFKKLSTVIAVVGSLLSANWLRTLGTGGLDVIEGIEGLLPLSFIAVSIVYIWFLHADTRAHQTLGEELRAGPARVQTRRRSQIVGYGVWNRSLLGQSGLLLVAIFFLLDSLSKLPVIERWFDDPVGYVVNLITENIEVLYEADGTIEAGRRLFRRLR